MGSTIGTARAADDTLTTTLQPGWNLVGWTEGEAEVAAIFEALPGLEAVYAWDAQAQSFRGAARLGDELPGELDTLTPGMGLWLYLGGTDPVEWTRPFLPESSFVTLAEGWNLVSWGGEDGLTVDDGLATLGAELGAVAAWDAESGQELHHVPGAPATKNTLQRLSRGSGLWIEVLAGRSWLQPGVTAPVEFGEEYSEDRRAELRALVDTALAFYAHRFGIFVPGITVHYRDDNEQACFYSNNTIFLKERCWTAIGHEYGHAVQEHLAPSDYRGPAWLIEGVANRWSAQFHEAREFRTYNEHLRETTWPDARRTPVPLEDLDDTLFVDGYGHHNYSIVHVAIDRLVELNGEDRTFRYHQERARYASWQEAFLGVFELSVDEFYADFANYRAEFFPQAPRVHGRVVGPDDQPLADVRVFGEPHEGAGAHWSAITSPDGTFEKAVSDGSYVVSFTDFSQTDDCQFGWYDGDTSLALSRVDALPLTVEGADINGVRISLSATPEALASELCGRVTGVVLGPAGEPVSGVHALLLRQDGLTEGDGTAADGAFSIVAPSGSYYLSLHHGGCQLGWLGPDGHVTRVEAVLLQVVGGETGESVNVRLPAPVSALCQ